MAEAESQGMLDQTIDTIKTAVEEVTT